MLKITALFTAGLLAFTPPVEADQGRPKAAFIMADIGPGGAPLRNEAYAERAASIVVEALAKFGLQEGDMLTVKTFGNPSMLEHLAEAEWNRTINFTFSGAKVTDMAEFIDQRVAALAEISPHVQSDLMYGLAEIASGMPCATHDVVTVILTNGIEAGEVAGNSFSLTNIPADVPFCGSLLYVGLWVIDAQPVPGLKSEAEALFVELGTTLGFSDVQIRR